MYKISKFIFLWNLEPVLPPDLFFSNLTILQCKLTMLQDHETVKISIFYKINNFQDNLTYHNVTYMYNWYMFCKCLQSDKILLWYKTE